MAKIDAYFEALKNEIQVASDPNIAVQQEAYMKHFAFLGLKMPVWTAIFKAYTKKHGWPAAGDDLHDFVALCYGEEYRELHYIALECVEKHVKKCPKDYIALLEHLICTHSWWDSVDWLAKIVGMYFQQFPEEIRPVTERWMDSGNRWLQRVSIIFQLRYRHNTDAELMFGYIRRVMHSKEFFLQKGAGWALREYSKSNPEAVQNFVQENEKSLPPLTKREALRLMFPKAKGIGGNDYVLK